MSSQSHFENLLAYLRERAVSEDVVVSAGRSAKLVRLRPGQLALTLSRVGADLGWPYATVSRRLRELERSRLIRFVQRPTPGSGVAVIQLRNQASIPQAA